MKRFTIFALCFCFLAAAITSTTAADGDKKEKKKSRMRVVIPEYDIEMDFRGYEKMLEEELAPQLSDLEAQLKELENINFHELKNLRELEGVVIDIPKIPDINIEIPPIPPMPHIAVHIPEIDLRGIDFAYDFHSGAHKLYEELSDEEELRLQVMRSVSRQDVDKAIPALEKVAREETSPALRYEAIHQLGRFLEDERVVPILGDIVKNDDNLTVRKKAIRLLGKSNDPRAVEILQGIVGE